MIVTRGWDKFTIKDYTTIGELKEENNILLKLKNQKRVLVAEDNETNQIVTKNILKQMNFIVDIVNNGKEALEKVKNSNYDIIFMDLQMPIMNGFEASKKIREFDNKIPIIALSATVMQKDKELTAEAGMNRHILKPIDRQELYSTISDFFELIEKSSEQIDSNIEFIDIDGIDVKEIYRVIGNIDSVYSMLKSFRDSYKDGFSEDSSVFIHKLKGVSGNLKIYKLHQLCKEIELEKDEKKLNNLKEKLHKNLKSVVANISNKLQDKEINISSDKFEILFNQLLEDIDEYALIEIKTIDLVISYFKSKIEKSKIDNIKKLFEEYNLEKLKILLMELKKEVDG